MDWQRGIPQTLQVSTHELTKPNPAQEKKARDLQQPAGVVQTSSASSSDPMTASCRTCGLRRPVRTRRGANQLRGGGARVALRARARERNGGYASGARAKHRGARDRPASASALSWLRPAARHHASQASPIRFSMQEQTKFAG